MSNVATTVTNYNPQDQSHSRPRDHARIRYTDVQGAQLDSRERSVKRGNDNVDIASGSN